MNRDHAFGRACVRVHDALRSAARGRSLNAALSVFLSIMLSVTMVPAAALAAPGGSSADADIAAAAVDDVAAGVVAAAENGDAADAAGADGSLDGWAPDKSGTYENQEQTQGTSGSEESSHDVILSGGGEALGVEESRGSEGQEGEEGSQGGNATIPAVDVINQEVALDAIVAQTESTKTFMLAQTLESTRTVPIVSAKLPLDTTSGDRADQSSAPKGQPEGVAGVDGSSEGDGSSDEGGEGSDDPDLAGSDASLDDWVLDKSGTYEDQAAETQDGAASAPVVAAASTVVGSFIYEAGVYAIGPDEGAVTLTAVDGSRIPEENKGVFIMPSQVTPDPDSEYPDYYFVNRVAAYALEGSGVTVFVVSREVTTIEENAFANCATLQRVEVSALNQNYSSYDGVVYDDADVHNLLLVPEGRKGAVRISPTAESIDPQAFSHLAEPAMITVDEGSAAFTSRNGLLYDAEGTTLLRVPSGLDNIIISGNVTAVADDAFEGCDKLTKIQVQNEDVLQLFEGKADEVKLAEVKPGDVLEAWYQDPECTAAYQKNPRELSYEMTVNEDFSLTLTKAPLLEGLKDLLYIAPTVSIGDCNYILSRISEAALMNCGSIVILLDGIIKPNGALQISENASPIQILGKQDLRISGDVRMMNLGSLMSPVVSFGDLSALSLMGSGAASIFPTERASVVDLGCAVSPEDTPIHLQGLFIDGINLYVEVLEDQSVLQNQVFPGEREVLSASASALSARWTPVIGSGFTFYSSDNYTSNCSVSLVSEKGLNIYQGILAKQGSGYQAQGDSNSVYLAAGTVMSGGSSDEAKINETYSAYSNVKTPGYSTDAGYGLYYGASAGFFYTYGGTSNCRYLLDSSNRIVKCKAAATKTGDASWTTGSNAIYLLIAPPYTINLIYQGSWADPDNSGTTINGTWTSKPTTNASGYSFSGSTGTWDTNIEENGTNSVTPGKSGNSYYYMPEPTPNNGDYVFVGWNRSASATATTTSGWYYRKNGTADLANTALTASTTLYAIYQKGYPLTWNVSKFGGAGSSGSLVNNSNSPATGTWSNGSQQEVVKILNPNATSNHYGAVTFPNVAHTKDTDTSADTDGMRFLGWTNDANGGFPVDKSGARASYYFKPGDGKYYVYADRLVSQENNLNRTFTLDMANTTWYAVWESAVDFNAASYGGKIVNSANGVTGQTWFKNNVDMSSSSYNPSARASIPATATSGASANNFVPNQYNENGYSSGNWEFRGWTKTSNPNNTTTLGGSTLRYNQVSPSPGTLWSNSNLIPNGKTTYYGVWECAIVWVATHPLNSATNMLKTVNTAAGLYLYGYNATTPSVTPTSPFSHSFTGWKDTAGNLSTGMNTDITSNDHGKSTYTVRTGGAVTAQWVANKGVVKLNSNGGSVPNNPIAASGNDQYTFATYGDLPTNAKLLYAVASGATDYGTSGNVLKTPKREGYQFAGYWNHPWSESSQAGQYSGALAKYFDDTNNDGNLEAVFDAVTAWNLVGQPVELFAHWKYVVKLDLNTWDSDGNLVTKAGAAGEFDGTPAWSGATPSTGTFATEQKDYSESVVSADGKKAYSFTAIAGAPIQLPEVTGRRGYTSTSEWGTAIKQTAKWDGSGNANCGAADGVIGFANGTTRVTAENPAVGTPVPTGSSAAIGEAGTVTLYANWAGHAKKYTVVLTMNSGGFSPSANASYTLYEQTYDQPLSGFTGLGLGAMTSTKGNDTLVFQGIYPVEYSKAYSKRDTTHAVNGAGVRDTWYVKNDGTTAARAFREVPATETNNTGTVTLYALWGYPEVEIQFDLQDNSSRLEGRSLSLTGGAGDASASVANGEFAYELITNDAMPGFFATASDGKTQIERVAESRPGFTFNGFWNTKWAEDQADSRDTNGVVPTQYYKADGTCVYNQTGGGTWNKTYTQKLYAHWVYDVFLEPNAVNSSGELVLNSAKSDYATTVTWPAGVSAADGGFATEQDSYSVSGTHAVSGVKVQQLHGPATAEEAVNLTRYRFRAVDGAPLQLPSVTRRTGYTDTKAWGTSAGGLATGNPGAALNLLGYADNDRQLTNPAQVKLVAVSDGTLGADGTRYAYVLYADWSGADARSGKAKQYQVNLRATYGPTATGDSFEVADGALATQTVTATYDQPLPLPASSVREYATGGNRNYVDATRDSANASRNLVLKGFYRNETRVDGVAVSDANPNRPYVLVADEAFTSASMPFREVSADGTFGTTSTPIDLFAWWGYNDTKITFDLQGGTINGQTAAQLGSKLELSGVKSHDATPNLSGNSTLGTAPKREGYTFAGWWNTPYREAGVDVVGGVLDAVTGQMSGGVSVTPTQYYDDTCGVSEKTWKEYADTTLYAHWVYNIEFRANLSDPDHDICDITVDLVKTDNNTAQVTGIVPLSAAGDDDLVDEYGNAYHVSSATKGDYTNGRYAGLTVTAIAGAPVKLPSAAKRRTVNENIKAYELIGYNATWEWSESASDTSGKTGIAYHGQGVSGYAGADKYYTTNGDADVAEGSWAGGLPVKVGNGTTTGIDGSTPLALYALWNGAKMDFDVRVMYSYDQQRAEDDGTTSTVDYDVASPHADFRTFSVTYDEKNYAKVDGGTDLLADGRLAAVDSTGAHALATHTLADGTALEYDNLDFAGVTTVRPEYKDNAKVGESTNDFFLSATRTDYATEESHYGTMYWDANGNMVQNRFRAIKGGDVEIYNTDRGNAANYRPYEMYVAWAQPTREVTFDFFGLEDAAGETSVNELDGAAFRMQKGRAMAEGTPNGRTQHEAQLKKLAEKVKQIEASTGYVFGGFWSAPKGVSSGSGTVSYENYEEVSRHASPYAADTPTCYYVLEGETLVPASADAQGWLTADNTSGTWLEDKDVTLYAHWKYDLTLSMDYDDVIPVQVDGEKATSDLIWFGGSTDYDAVDSPAAITVDFATLDTQDIDDEIDVRQRQTDAHGRLTYGAPLVIPMNGGGQANQITRLRDFGSKNAEKYGFSGLGLTGYDFVGWTRDANRSAFTADADGTETLDADVITYARNAYLEGADNVPLTTMDLAPDLDDIAAGGEPGHVTLYAQWKAKEYDLSLKYRPKMYDSAGTQYISTGNTDIKETGTQHITMKYDQRFTDALPKDETGNSTIQPPKIYGLNFLGYFSSEVGTVSGATVSDAGVQFFGETNATGDYAGLSRAYRDPWFQPVDGGQDSATIYAYYERQTYWMTFDKLDEGDGTLQKLRGTNTDNVRQQWYYNQKLTTNAPSALNTDAVNWADLLPANAGFERHGYDFEGWYILKASEEEIAAMSEAEQQAYRADRSNRVYLYYVDGFGISGEPNAKGVSTVTETFTERKAGTPLRTYSVNTFDGITTWCTPASLRQAGLPEYDAEAGYTVYAGWRPKAYTLLFDYNLKNNPDKQMSELYRTYYEDVIATPDPQTEGAPFTLKGWNERKDGAAAYTDQWLLDKTKYDPSRNQSETTDSFDPMMPPKTDGDVSGRFMPYNTGTYDDDNPLELYAVWEKPENQRIYLFQGARGTISRGGVADGYTSVPLDYEVGWHIDEPAGLADYYPSISLNVNSGYVFAGWKELSASDIACDAAVTRYEDVDWSAVSVADIMAGSGDGTRAGVNTTQFAAGLKNVNPFPTATRITSSEARSYKRTASAAAGVQFRDIYLVATYNKIDYSLTLDLGDASKYGYSANQDLGARLDTKRATGYDRDTADRARIKFTRGYSMDDAADDAENGLMRLPDAVSSLHRFTGWTLPSNLKVGAGMAIEDAAAAGIIDWYYEDAEGNAWIKRADFADYLREQGGLKAFTLTANWDDRAYTVKFVGNHPDQDVEAGAEDITLTDLTLDSKFTLPYPATRGEGMYFNYWSLLTSVEEDPFRGVFWHGDEFTLGELINQINKGTDGKLKDHSGQDYVSMQNVVLDENDCVTFVGRWGQAISVDVPLEVTVKVDPVNQVVLTADNLKVQARYVANTSIHDSVKVASLRYDRVDAGDGQFVFPDGAENAGKAYLSIYADMVTTGDNTHLFVASNVEADGTLKSGVSQQYPPLLIDLSKDAIFADAYPEVTGEGTWQNLPENGHEHGVVDEDGTAHGLHSHGFRAFGASEAAENQALPIRYGLLFSDFAGLMDYAPKLSELTSDDASSSFPIAHLYYTIALNRKAS